MRDSIRVFLRGGLGNQLFGWAAGYSLAKRHSVPLELVPGGIEVLARGALVERRAFELGSFGLSATKRRLHAAVKPNSSKAWLYRKVCQASGRTLFVEGQDPYDPAIEQLGNRTDIHGYFQSWRYFSSVIDEVRFALTDSFIPTDEFLRLRDELDREPWLGVHVRLGDYRTIGTMHSLSAHNLQDAVSRLRQETGIDRVVLFSEDSIEANELFSSASRTISTTDLARPADSLMLMGLAYGNVYSNSTFSWWSAMLHYQPRLPKYFPDHWYAGTKTPIDSFLLPFWSTFRS